MIKIKNKTYQPLPLLIDGQTIVLPGRRSLDVQQLTDQMVALKGQGLIQVIKS